MKAFIKQFILRGLLAAGGGPLVLAVIYGTLGATGAASSFSPREVCLGIVSVTLLAFTVAGMTAIYQLEQLPLAFAIIIHGSVLYLSYILVYLINGWLKQQLFPVLIFSAVFLIGYALIWLIIYFTTKVKTDRINQTLSAR